MGMRREVRPVRRPGRRVVVKRRTGMEWLPIVIVIALLVIGGIVAWVVISNNDNNAATSAAGQPVAAFAALRAFL
jgi:flagellar basal body-associated protein FliL